MSEPFDALPIVIGVTGHRNIPPDALPRLRSSFERVLDSLVQRYSNTPLLVLSALAAGADILAAQAALERGIRVRAILPMPQADYEQDFTDAERGVFREVLAKCETHLIVGDVNAQGGRVNAYAAAGTYIVYYSHILVALWDGLPGNGAGGTADMVGLRTTGIRSITQGQIVPYLPDIGPIFQIVTPRIGAQPPLASCELIKIYPPRYEDDKQSRRDFEAALANLDRYNRDLGKTPVHSLRELMDRTDQVANALQSKYLHSLNLVYVSAAIAGAAQIVDVGQGAIIRFGILAIAFLFFRKARKEDFENRYQDYRAISEGLRVQSAWCSAGLNERMVDAAYSRMQHSELQWIRMAIRTAYLESGAGAPREQQTGKDPECSQWIDDQRKYYKRAAPREQRRLKDINRFSTMFMLACVAITAVAIILNLPFTPHLPPFVAALPLPKLQWVQHHKAFIASLQTAPVALAALVALLLRFYVQQRGFTENARRYAHMHTVFDFAQKRLGLIDDGKIQDDRPRIIEELGREALIEHADWLVLHRERPFQFVSM